MCVIPSFSFSFFYPSFSMRKFRHPKTTSAILIVLLGFATAALSACGQRGPLKLPEPGVAAGPASPSKPIPQESPAK